MSLVPTSGNDNLFFSSQPAGGTYTITDTGGTDYLYLADSASTRATYLARFPRANFTINPVDANGVIVITTFNLKGIEYVVFSNGAGGSTTVALSYVPADSTPPTASTFSPADTATAVGEASDIMVTFSEAIQKGTGTIEIRSGSATGNLFES